MEKEELLYKKIQQAVEKEFPTEFKGKENVWNRIEDKLENYTLKKEKTHWKKISFVAGTIIISIVIYLFISKICIEKKSFPLQKEKTIPLIVADSILNYKNPPSLYHDRKIIRQKNNSIIDSISPNKSETLTTVELQQVTAPVPVKNTTIIYAPVHNPTVDSIAKHLTKEKKINPNESKGTRISKYNNFPPSKNTLDNTNPSFKNPDPLVVIDGEVKSLKKLQDMIENDIADSVSVLKKPLYIINGIEFTEESLFGHQPTSPYYPLHKQDILETTIYKEEEALQKFGKKGAYGVAVITTKHIKVNQDQLVVINDQIVPNKVLTKLSTNWISYTLWIPKNEAIKKYGPQGSQGAIYIKTIPLPEKDQNKINEWVEKYRN